MSTEARLRASRRRVPGLGDWVRALVDACDLDPAGGGARLRSVVGTRRARIALDDDVIEVWLRGSSFEIGPLQHEIPVDGTGSTTSDLVLDLLDGGREVSRAFHDGSIVATGHRQSVTRIFHAIEILLDASSRVPEMRRLADEFRAGRGPRVIGAPEPTGDDSEEHQLLARLGLLGDRA